MIIKGNKVVLRPVRISDAPRFVKWFNDPEVNKFMLLRHLTMKYEIKYIKNLKKNKEKHNLAIETREGSHIGVTGVEVNKNNNYGGFGIMIGEKDYWSHGFGEEASRLLINYAFSKLKLHRLDLDVYAYNKRAINLYKKLGFKKEGLKRDHNFYKGRYTDVIYMGLLGKEWKK